MGTDCSFRGATSSPLFMTTDCCHGAILIEEVQSLQKGDISKVTSSGQQTKFYSTYFIISNDVVIGHVLDLRCLN